MFKKIIAFVSIAVVMALVLFFAIDGSASKEADYQTVTVERGNIIDKALAVGCIEPRNEISVKSKISGIVRKAYAKIGDQVDIGDPLFDIAPDPTPIEYAETRRHVELYRVAYESAKREFNRTKSMRDKQLISHQEYDRALSDFEDAQLRLKLAEEKLSLIESGQTQIAGLKVDNIIRSPIRGKILSRLVEEGDPVVPLTSYQAGTELMTLAQMESLIFKGNVDEIDVGKLSINMPVEIEIGALPNEKMTGVLASISPKAHRDEGAILFEVEIELDSLGGSILRAGYSANADIIITKRDSILLIPERLVTMKDSLTSVEVVDTAGVVSTREVEVGLSDGLNIEVIAGLEENELVVERPPKEITGD